jgi:tripartite-type tricarboxylate transporter receptor subunit TctC
LKFRYEQEEYLCEKEDNMNKKRVLVLMWAVIGLILTSGSALAAAPYYDGKVIRIVVGFSAGGGYDLYARALSRHLGKHIPGSPAIIVDNMPGAGSLISANYLYKMAKPDGLTIGHFQAGLFVSQVLEQPGVEFDGRKFLIIGSLTKDNPVCVLNKARGIKSLEELVASKTQVKLGTAGTGQGGDMVTRVAGISLGLPIKVIAPFPGQSDIRLAMEKGEIEGTFWPFDSLMLMVRKAVEAGDIIIVLQAIPKPLPSLPNLPVWGSLAKSSEARQTVGLLDTLNELGRPFTFPPGTPNELLQVLRKAFQETLKDKEFLAEAQKAQMGLDPSTGEELEKQAIGIYKAVDPSLIPKLKELFYK